jgi:glycerol kinase
VEALAKEVKNLDELKNILFFPFFTGIGSPYWNAEAKASIIGLTRDSGRSHIAHAALEGIALSINDLLNAMKKDTGLSISSLKVDGGAVENNLLMELQSTISDTKIIRPKVIETTAFGAALAAAIGAKLVTMDDLKNIWQMEKEFLPNELMKSYITSKKLLWNDIMKKFYQT